MKATLVVSCAVAAFGSVALGNGTFTETFSEGTPHGAFFIVGEGDPAVFHQGGNPGAYFTKVDQTSPSVLFGMQDGDTLYSGNLRAKGMLAIGLDVLVNKTQENLLHPDFHLTLTLGNDNGTPGNLFDDTRYHAQLAQGPPLVGAGWKSFDFPVPIAATQLPTGWELQLDFFGQGPPNPLSWDAVIQDVDYFWISFGNPQLIYAITNWEVRVDNVRAVLAAPLVDLDVVNPAPSPGDVVELTLLAPGLQGAPYVAALAFGTTPGIPTPFGNFPLNADPLLFASAGKDDALFDGFGGAIAPSGRATARLGLPAHPSVSGISFFAAFAVLPAAGPWHLSGAEPIAIQ